MASKEFTVKITGLKQLDKNLRILGRTFGDPKYALQALRPAIRKALLPLKSIIESKTPKDTGDLAKSTTIRITKTNKREKKRAGNDSVIFGKIGWFWKKPDTYWRRALAVEFGTSEKSARPVLRPALESNVQRMLSTFKKTLGKAIEKKAIALNKKKK